VCRAPINACTLIVLYLMVFVYVSIWIDIKFLIALIGAHEISLLIMNNVGSLERDGNVGTADKAGCITVAFKITVLAFFGVKVNRVLTSH